MRSFFKRHKGVVAVIDGSGAPIFRRCASSLPTSSTFDVMYKHHNFDKFCRICISTGVSLTDIESKDEDSLRFSDKLRECTAQLEISKENLSNTKICLSCIQKLRISYQFQLMCKNSNAILQQYIDHMLDTSHRTTITTKSPKPRRKRIGKDERCSLLKKLLCPSEGDHSTRLYNAHINGLSELCERLAPSVTIESVVKKEPTVTAATSVVLFEKPKGLQNLLDFTKNYDFGSAYDSLKPCTNNVDLTPLDCLAKFTDSFFYDHFGDYRDVILHIRDHVNFHCDTGSDNDESMFDTVPEDEKEEQKERSDLYGAIKKSSSPPPPPSLLQSIKQEIVIVEPDFDFKKEQFYNEDYEESTLEQDETMITSNLHSHYEEEQPIANVEMMTASNGFVPTDNNNICGPLAYPQNYFDVLRYYGQTCMNNLAAVGGTSSSSDLVYNYKKHRTLSPHSVKCRTRGNPFINPQLKNQFQMRDFKCSTCQRVFKSPGYLKAHRSKLGH